MTRTSSVALVAVALLAVLAGCGAEAPGATTTADGDETFEVELGGNSSATYFVAADLVADPLDSVTVTYANGSARKVETPRSNGAATFGAESNVTDVEHGGEVVGGAYFEGTPRFSVTAHDVTPTRNAVFTVRKAGEDVLVAWGVVRCGGHVTHLSLTVGETGTLGVGLGCAG